MLAKSGGTGDIVYEGNGGRSYNAEALEVRTDMLAAMIGEREGN